MPGGNADGIPRRERGRSGSRWYLAVALIVAAVVDPAAADALPATPLTLPGGYGRLDVDDLPLPEVVATAPALVAEADGLSPAPTVYLRVRPGERETWGHHCVTYNACGIPVRFVSERWYRQIYRTQGRDADGSARRESERERRDRNNERESHPGHEAD